MDYDKNLKPFSKPTSVSAFGKTAFQQGNSNKAPIVRPQPMNKPFDILTNKVTAAGSASLQKASKLPGRVVMESAPVTFN